jgi:Bacterial dnaA protein helix-turn-helix
MSAQVQAINPSINQIGEIVSTASGISMTDIRSSRLTSRATLARQVFMWLARKHTTNSTPVIGRMIGGRDHTTVLNAINRVDERLARGDVQTRNLVATCELALAAAMKTASLINARLIIDPDPLEAARRVLAPGEGPTRVSVIEITAMACLIQQALAPIVEIDGRVDQSPPDLSQGPIHRVSLAAARAVVAWSSWIDAQFTIGERRERHEMDAAMKALREIIQQNAPQETA